MILLIRDISVSLFKRKTWLEHYQWEIIFRKTCVSLGEALSRMILLLAFCIGCKESYVSRYMTQCHAKIHYTGWQVFEIWDSQGLEEGLRSVITFRSGDWSVVWTRLSFFSFGIPMLVHWPWFSLVLVHIEGTDSWERGDKKNHVVKDQWEKTQT